MRPLSIALAAAIVVAVPVVAGVALAGPPSTPQLVSVPPGATTTVTHCTDPQLSPTTLAGHPMRHSLSCPVATSTTSTSSTTTTTMPTTTTTQPTGGNCSPPYLTTETGAQDTYDTDGGFNWVSNDAWNGSHGPQSVQVCGAGSWNAISNQTNQGGQVETYPDTEYDVGGRNNQSTEPISAFNSITSTFAEAFPASGWSGDAGYDLWTNNWQHETMIWTDVRGTQTYWSNCAEPGPDFNTCGLADAPVAVTLDGVAYHHFSYGTKGSNAEQVFVRDTFTTSGSVDILAMYQWEVANGWASASQNPTQLEYGTEICATTGTQTFPLTGLTFSLS